MGVSSTTQLSNLSAVFRLVLRQMIDYPGRADPITFQASRAVQVLIAHSPQLIQEQRPDGVESLNVPVESDTADMGETPVRVAHIIREHRAHILRERSAENFGKQPIDFDHSDVVEKRADRVAAAGRPAVEHSLVYSFESTLGTPPRLFQEPKRTPDLRTVAGKRFDCKVLGLGFHKIKIVKLTFIQYDGSDF